LIHARNQKTEVGRRKSEIGRSPFLTRLQSSAICLLISIRSEKRDQAIEVRGNPAYITIVYLLIRKDQFCFKHIRDLCGQAQITTGMLGHGRQKTENRRRKRSPLFAAVSRRQSSGKPDALPLHDVKFSRA
jgi:hypothetical protein